MNPLDILLNNLQNDGTLAFGIVSIILSVIALTVSLRSAHTDRINANTWETYRAYNSDEVRRGRALALQVLKDTQGHGLPTYADYHTYFKLDVPAEERSPDLLAYQAQRQYLHDLAGFYHQTGVLLEKGRLDTDFTLLTVGPGLEDRWQLLTPLASYYEDGAALSGDFPYGGMYLLYRAYARWKRSEFARLRRKFVKARADAKKEHA